MKITLQKCIDLFYSCHIKGYDSEMGPQTFLMIASYGTTFIVMLINNIYIQHKIKRTNEKFRRYLGQQHVEEANKEYHEIMIKFETQISKTVNWMFFAFTLLNLPSKRDK